MTIFKLILLAAITTLAACSYNIQSKPVDCTGHMFEGLDHRHYSSKLIKYAPDSKRFFSAGDPVLGLRGWMRMDEFDKITCVKGKGIED
ncbi:hypothetical protein JC861_14010 [Morganella morganii]|uniref:hypothetical protein n=1 Tax=Morganella morganii TaxID=582 RepID=UPI001C47E694|nr:hypothetical protein [Morganella morganii]QXO48959.1 hypothetical protein JC861_14010 [Morganella morganii]QXO52819.1 hypothetical protein JC830_13990 [Morganella morganii]